ncbi:MAG: bifunctional UDP-N-acetylglucosamine diphosphorylase/glucosamine-1-phosphate N-acetyltransferase GlmU [Ectothiorhodospiraceae bacterium]|nr:bifunctional UDP-N-acetylglucosamine diphosphorylase/glucosamine-1-phosphate N-acetyltransferase GlmU [Ectothiorhodospiraceae bacterium]
MELHTVILAAGQGTRMRSRLPKVLHPLAGRPMVAHVIETARELDSVAVHLVYGHGGERVTEALAEAGVRWVRQEKQLGTGHAVLQALPEIPDHALVLVLYGDVPLVRSETLRPLLELAREGAAILTTRLPDPTGYGRIVRCPDGEVSGIVEQKDASPDQLAITEINTGLLAAPAGKLKSWLQRCGNDNAQGEYYLTDIVALAVADGQRVCAVDAPDAEEVSGVNSRPQLAALERAYQRRQAEQLMLAGVTLLDPSRLDIRGTLRCGQDVSIDVNCVFEGDVELGEGVTVGPNCVLRNSRIGPHSVIESHCLIDDSTIASGCSVGPYARLRPGSQLADGARIGNFVEVKKSIIGAGSKVNHLSYIGDATLGAGVNVGAGTITCNYDGVNKHKTVIEDGAFIGSDTQLVAPVTVGRNTVVGAGTTVTRDTGEDALVVSRAPQKNIPGWRRRSR